MHVSHLDCPHCAVQAMFGMTKGSEIFEKLYLNMHCVCVRHWRWPTFDGAELQVLDSYSDSVRNVSDVSLREFHTCLPFRAALWSSPLAHKDRRSWTQSLVAATVCLPDDCLTALSLKKYEEALCLTPLSVRANYESFSFFKSKQMSGLLNRQAVHNYSVMCVG